MEKAWTFYRRSTDRQELSIEDQRREVQAYAEQRGWQIVREFQPHLGYASGLTIDRDAVFLEMVRSAEHENHGVKYLLVYDVSRFGRLQPEDKIYWERRLMKQGGIQIVYAKDDFRNDGSIGDILTKVVKHSEAHQYSLKLSEVTLRGAKSHAALGHSAGGVAPYGYDRLEVDSAGQAVRVMSRTNDWKSNKLNHVVWTPSVTAAAVVRSMFESYDKGVGLNRIAHRLNREGVQPPRGRHWSKSMIHYLLRNRSYLGERTYNRRSYKAYRRGERSCLSNPPESWVTNPRAHEAIVAADLFDRVQATFKTRVTTTGRSFERPYLLTGLVRCSNCGYRMTGQPLKGNGHKYLTYVCSGYLRIGKSVCRSVHVHTDQLEQEVLRSIREHLSSPGWKEQVRETLVAMIKTEYGSGAQSQADDVQRQLQVVNRQITNVVDAIKLSGRLSEAMNQALEELEAQRDSLRSSLAKIEKRVSAKLETESLTDEIIATCSSFDRILNDGLDAEERRELLRCYVHQVNVSHSPTDIRAEVWLYKIPMAEKKETLAREDLRPLITKVCCGGRQQTIVKGPPSSEILDLLVSATFALKAPYRHSPGGVSRS